MGIEVRSLSKHYGSFRAANDVSFEVPDGSLVALLGPSGSGKSTILRIIAGLETADSGSVLLAGEDVTRVPVQQRGVGFVFQHYALFRHLTVRDNIAFGAQGAQASQGGDQGPGRRASRSGSACRLRGPIPISALGRPAAAGRPARRWRPGRRSCSLMSPSAPSTPRSATSSAPG